MLYKKKDIDNWELPKEKLPQLNKDLLEKDFGYASQVMLYKSTQ